MPPHRGKDKVKRRGKIERDFLLALLDEFGPDDAREIMTAIKARAKEGDAAALKFIGTFVLGGGRVPLTEAHHPSMIRRAR